MSTNVDLTAHWGWSNPPEEVVRIAQIAADSAGDQGAVLRSLDVLDRATLARLLETRPGHLSVIEYAVVEQPAKVQPYVEQVLALSSRQPFYAQLKVLDPHAGMKAPNVVRRCEALDCVLMLIESSRPVIVFSSHKSMMQFGILGRKEKQQDPLLIEAGEEPLLAVGSRDDISAIIAQSGGRSEVFAAEQAQVWHASSSETQSSQAQRELARLLDHAIEKGASDIALVPRRDGTYSVKIRRWGALVDPRTAGKWNQQMAADVIGVLEDKSGANPSKTIYRSPRDGQISYRSTVGEAFLRLSFVPLNHPGEVKSRPSVSIRLFSHSESKIDLESLGLPEEVVDAIDAAVRMPAGAILLAGPMNSGKSTTIAGALGRHVDIYGETLKRVTVEEPIERFLPDLIQVNVPPVMLGADGSLVEGSDRFNIFLRGLKRHDVNVFWVGEVRDDETADFCVTSAVTGCLSLSTIHAKDCVLAFDVLSQWVAPNKRFQLSEAVALVVSQRLVPALCGHCKVTSGVTQADRKLWASYMDMVGESHKLPSKLARRVENAESKCPHCEDGYSGYSVVCEVLPFNREVRTAAGQLASRGSGIEEARATMAKNRTLTMVESAWRRLKDGVVDLRSVLYL